MSPKQIGRMIKVRRASRNMTQDDLAAATGLGQSTIASYESGARRPSKEAAEALADAFNVPVWSIYYDESEVIPKEEAQSNDAWRSITPGFDTIPAEKQNEFLAMVGGLWNAYKNNIVNTPDDQQRKD